jgi:hypothetical protein
MAKPLETGKIYDLSRENDGLSTVDSGATSTSSLTRPSDGQCPGPGGVRPPSRWFAGGPSAVTVTGPGVTARLGVTPGSMTRIQVSLSTRIAASLSLSEPHGAGLQAGNLT